MKKSLLIVTLIVLRLAAFAQVNVFELLDKAVEMQKSNDLMASIILCDRVIEIDSTIANAHFLRGYNHFLLKNFNDAISDFSNALTHNPDYLDAYYYRARAKQAKGDFMGAMRDFNHSRELNPVQTTFMIARGLFSSIFGGSQKDDD